MELALQSNHFNQLLKFYFVTILVFMELALQFCIISLYRYRLHCHNPCFYGISFAIEILRVCCGLSTLALLYLLFLSDFLQAYCKHETIS